MVDTSKFITIEGIDGSGKSTFIPIIQQMLEESGEQVVLTREPGGTPFAEVLREHILNTKMDKHTEVLLNFAARNEHMKDVILPALKDGKVVVSDRFVDSTYAYQGGADGVSIDYIKTMERLVLNGLKPEITFIFTVPTAVSKQRLAKTGKTPDKFESQKEDYFYRALVGYENRAKEDPDRCILIDSSLSIEHTKKQVLLHMKEYLKKLDLKKNKKNGFKKSF